MRRGPTRRRSAVGVLAVLVLLIAGAVSADAAISSLVERRISLAVTGSFSSVESVEVHARAFPALLMLFGRYDTLTIDVVGAVVSSMRISGIHMESAGARIPMRKFDPGSSEWANALGEATVTMAVSEDDLNRYIAARESALNPIRVSLVPGKALVSARVALAGLAVDIRAEGRIVVRSGPVLAYVVDSVKMDSREIPQFLVGAVREMLDLSLDLAGLPFGIRLDAVEIADGMAYLRGQTQDARTFTMAR